MTEAYIEQRIREEVVKTAKIAEEGVVFAEFTNPFNNGRDYGVRHDPEPNGTVYLQELPLDEVGDNKVLNTILHCGETNSLHAGDPEYSLYIVHEGNGLEISETKTK